MPRSLLTPFSLPPGKGPHHLMELLLLLLSRFSCVWLCATPEMAAHQAPTSLGFSRQAHWSGLPFLSPMHESEKWKWSCSVMSDSQQPHGLQPTRLLCPWDFPGKSTGVGCHCLLQLNGTDTGKSTYLLKCICSPQINTHSTLTMINEHVLDEEAYELPTGMFPASCFSSHANKVSSLLSPWGHILCISVLFEVIV